jgi:hypothetical protein
MSPLLGGVADRSGGARQVGVEVRVRRRSMTSAMDQWIIAAELAGFVSYYSAFPVIPTWRDPGLCCGLVLVC